MNFNYLKISEKLKYLLFKIGVVVKIPVIHEVTPFCVVFLVYAFHNQLVFCKYKKQTDSFVIRRELALKNTDAPNNL